MISESLDPQANNLDWIEPHHLQEEDNKELLVREIHIASTETQRVRLTKDPDLEGDDDIQLIDFDFADGSGSCSIKRPEDGTCSYTESS